MKAHFELMANYNAVMNQKISDAISSAHEELLWADNKAFFGSILGTLNHLMVGDLIWLRRFNNHSNYSNGFNTLQSLVKFPTPTTLTQILYDNKADFIHHREVLDNIIIQFFKALPEANYEATLTYTNTKGSAHCKPFSMLLQHFFNHQTHHRGQVTTLLSQMNIDVGETDLLMLINNV